MWLRASVGFLTTNLDHRGRSIAIEWPRIDVLHAMVKL